MGRKSGSHTQALRILELHASLRRRRRGVTYAALAQELHVSTRQLHRDLGALEEAGHAIERTLDDDGRALVRLASSESVKLNVTRRERFTLLAVRRVFDVLRGTAFEHDVAAIYEKLRDTFSPEEVQESEDLSERFVYVPDGGVKPYADEEDDAHADTLDPLIDCVLRRHPARFRYRTSAGEAREGVLEPYALVLYKQGFYVIGVQVGRPRREKPHVYAVERFELVEGLKEERFVIPRGFRASRFFDGSFGIFLGDDVLHVVIDFTPTVRTLIAARVWHPSQKLSDLPGGGVRLELDVSSVTQVLSWVLSFGPHARVREPRALVERIRGEVAALGELYGSQRRT